MSTTQIMDRLKVLKGKPIRRFADSEYEGSSEVMKSPEIIYQKFGPRMAVQKKEIFMILLLNSANILTREYKISEGTLNASLVHPREVFQNAITELAASIILLHNHPSGEIRPSIEDQNITRRLISAGKLLDIPVLDHVIIGSQGYFSFKEEGMLDES